MLIAFGFGVGSPAGLCKKNTRFQLSQHPFNPRPRVDLKPMCVCSVWDVIFCDETHFRSALHIGFSAAAVKRCSRMYRSPVAPVIPCFLSRRRERNHFYNLHPFVLVTPSFSRRLITHHS